MPLKVEKRKFKNGTTSETYWMRGTVAGSEVFRSTRKTKKKEADRVALALENQLNQDKEVEAEMLFIEAADEYIGAGGEDRYLDKVEEFLGMYTLNEINQELLDAKAREAYPTQSNASRVRWFYTPAIAVHNFASLREWCFARRFVKPKIKPKPTTWAEESWFQELWKHCNDDVYRITVFLPYTGCRVSEALNLEWDRINLNKRQAYIPETKNSEPRTVNLPPIVIDSLLAIPEEKRKGRVFPWGDYHAVNWAVRRTVNRMNKDRDEPFKYLSSHKWGSHTYGTTMRRDAGMDAIGLVGTRRWKDLRSAARYSHTTASEESKKSDLLHYIKRVKA